ncbi:MAG TPA: hypothetical protein PKO22_08435 [Treponemataceae bacterium]|nr:hypothetical protein [Treponemataceae bacterium]
MHDVHFSRGARSRVPFVALFFAFALTGAVFADPFASFPQGLSGDYAVYRDYTWKSPTWIGLLRYDDTTWGALCVTPSTGSRVSILFRGEISDGTFVLVGQSIISNIGPGDVPAVNYLMKLIPETYRWRHDAASAVSATDGASAAKALLGSSPRSSLLPQAVVTAQDLPSFGGKVSLVWLPETPAMGLAGMVGSGGVPILNLARAGRIRSGGEDEFFGFTPISDAVPGKALSVPAKRVTEKRSVDGIQLTLDGQWTMVADNTYFLGNSAVIIVDTIDLEAMGIPRDNLPLSMVRLFSPSSGGSWAIPGELGVSGTAKRFRIVNLFQDGPTGIRNRDIKLCVPSADGKKCMVVSLSVQETAYKDNKAYFDSLF